MKIEVYDELGSGILKDFARSIKATVNGRFVYIPKSKGEGYLTGFSWSSGLRMMIRNYYLKEEFSVEWKNLAIEGDEPVVFQLTGVFPSLLQGEELLPETANVLICQQAVTSMITMPSHTVFRSVTIAAPRDFLNERFGQLHHPIIKTILQDKGNFAYELIVTLEMFKVADSMISQSITKSLENLYYELKCEELLCYIFSGLTQREPSPVSTVHMKDIQALYAIKFHLQSNLGKPPNIAALATEAAMSEPKLRRLFKQTFGKGVFEYYQALRMQEAARLLKENKLSVSEVGYQLGFTNLSHFSRVFEQHLGSKPKKYTTL